jgi:hypothetical protein
MNFCEKKDCDIIFIVKLTIEYGQMDPPTAIGDIYDMIVHTVTYCYTLYFGY